MIGSIAGLTDVGESREHNEDGFTILDIDTGQVLPDSIEQLALEQSPVMLAVSDGMGGASAGEVASALTLEVIQEHTAEAAPKLLTTSPEAMESWMAEVIQKANQRVRGAGQADPTLRGMGATVTLAAVFPGTVVLGHVGDSRAYLLNGGQLRQLTTDHTFVGQMVARGHITAEQAKSHDHRHLLLQAVGAKDLVNVDTLTVGLEPGDQLLLCSDGLYDMAEDEAIAEILSSGNKPDALCQALVQAALDGGGFDNITVIVLQAR